MSAPRAGRALWWGAWVVELCLGARAVHAAPQQIEGVIRSLGEDGKTLKVLAVDHVKASQEAEMELRLAADCVVALDGRLAGPAEALRPGRAFCAYGRGSGLQWIAVQSGDAGKHTVRAPVAGQREAYEAVVKTSDGVSTAVLRIRKPTGWEDLVVEGRQLPTAVLDSRFKTNRRDAYLPGRHGVYVVTPPAFLAVSAGPVGPAPALVTIGPYVQNTGTGAVTVVWYTETAAAGAVRYGAKTGAWTHTVTGTNGTTHGWGGGGRELPDRRGIVRTADRCRRSDRSGGIPCTALPWSWEYRLETTTLKIWTAREKAATASAYRKVPTDESV